MSWLPGKVEFVRLPIGSLTKSLTAMFSAFRREWQAPNAGIIRGLEDAEEGGERGALVPGRVGGENRVQKRGMWAELVGRPPLPLAPPMQGGERERGAAGGAN